jgi:hypothetical protein
LLIARVLPLLPCAFSPSAAAASEAPWPFPDLTTAYFKAKLVGSTLVVDIEWDDYFANFFEDSPYGNLSAVVISNAPTGCSLINPVTVTIHPADRKAQVVVPLAPDFLGCASAPHALVFMARIVWVSTVHGRRCACACTCWPLASTHYA